MKYGIKIGSRGLNFELRGLSLKNSGFRIGIRGCVWNILDSESGLSFKNLGFEIGMEDWVWKIRDSESEFRIVYGRGPLFSKIIKLEILFNNHCLIIIFPFVAKINVPFVPGIEIECSWEVKVGVVDAKSDHLLSFKCTAIRTACRISWEKGSVKYFYSYISTLLVVFTETKNKRT